MVQVNGGKHDEERLKKKNVIHCNAKAAITLQYGLPPPRLAPGPHNRGLFCVDSHVSNGEDLFLKGKETSHSGLTFHTEKLQKSKLNSSGQ